MCLPCYNSDRKSLIPCAPAVEEFMEEYRLRKDSGHWREHVIRAWCGYCVSRDLVSFQHSLSTLNRTEICRIAIALTGGLLVYGPVPDVKK